MWAKILLHLVFAPSQYSPSFVSMWHPQEVHHNNRISHTWPWLLSSYIIMSIRIFSRSNQHSLHLFLPTRYSVLCWRITLPRYHCNSLHLCDCKFHQPLLYHIEERCQGQFNRTRQYQAPRVFALAVVRRHVSHLQQHAASGRTLLLEVSRNRIWSTIRSTEITKALREAIKISVPQVSFKPTEVSTRSMQAGGSMAFLLARFYTNIIIIVGGGGAVISCSANSTHLYIT